MDYDIPLFPKKLNLSKQPQTLCQDKLKTHLFTNVKKYVRSKTMAELLMKQGDVERCPNDKLLARIFQGLSI